MHGSKSGGPPADDDDKEEDDNEVVDTDEVEDNDKDDNNFKDISALGLDRHLWFSPGHHEHQPPARVCAQIRANSRRFA